jgi:RNA polymerase sigma factor (sigma-70 family)
MTVLEACPGRGVEFEDLYQTGYLAMVAAVDTYDPAAGGVFSTWLMYHLKNAFAEATGYRTKRDHRDPLNNSISLDTPLSDEAGSDDLMEVVADPSGENGLISAEDALYRAQLHDAMEKALSAIPEQYADALRLRYFDGLTLEGAGEVRGVSGERIRGLENKGIRLLRRSNIACRLRPFYDFDFYYGAGYGAFQSSGMSIQERYLILEEERKERESHRDKKTRKKEVNNTVSAMMERIAAEAQEKVAAMPQEEKERLLQMYGLA